MRCCSGGTALAVLACACFVAVQAAPVPEEGLARLVPQLQSNGRGLLHVSEPSSQQGYEAVLEEVTKNPSSTLNSEDSEEDFESLWHRTPLEMFLAWLYGIFIIVAVGGLAAVVAAKLGFFDEVEQDDSVIPISPRTNAHLFQSTEKNAASAKAAEQHQQRADACLTVNYKPYQSYHQAGSPIIAETVSVHPEPCYSRYECCPNPASSAAEQL